MASVILSYENKWMSLYKTTFTKSFMIFIYNCIIAGLLPLDTGWTCSSSRPDVSTGCLGIATRRGLQEGEETCSICGIMDALVWGSGVLFPAVVFGQFGTSTQTSMDNMSDLYLLVKVEDLFYICKYFFGSSSLKFVAHLTCCSFVCFVK